VLIDLGHLYSVVVANLNNKRPVFPFFIFATNQNA